MLKQIYKYCTLFQIYRIDKKIQKVHEELASKEAVVKRLNCFLNRLTQADSISALYNYVDSYDGEVAKLKVRLDYLTDKKKKLEENSCNHQAINNAISHLEGIKKKKLEAKHS
jgi:uncharacterized coiled-coil protein SlyX